ncbi:MAG TPA: tetratricopeptide repeat protein [Chthoniobacterales bacterium]|nr:tetratricopeptide repeat protein [Chthoniobacterales bacterium]
MDRRFRVFISSTTHDLRSYRDAAAKIVREEKKLEGIDEGTFATMEYRAVRRHLWELIQISDAVIFLIGWQFGGEPAERPANVPRRSFAQLEWDFARVLGKPCHVFFASESCPFDQPVWIEPDEVRLLQREHRDSIGGVMAGGLWHHFGSLEELERLIRAIDFPTLAPQRPRKVCALPFAAMGALFVGREADLTALDGQLGVQGATAALVPAQTIHGLGGIGKTRLAVEYAWAFADRYSTLLFVSAETPEVLALNLSRLARPEALALSEPEEDNESRQLELVLHWLERETGWLLILDNADSPDAAAAVREVLPRLSGGRVIITSRLASWNAGVQKLALGVLSEVASVAYLLGKCLTRLETENDGEAVAALARDLGGLALALEQASAFINLHGLSFAEYRERWAREDAAVRAWFDEDLMRYPRSVATTWETSFAELGDDARALLRLLCWVSTDPAPRGLFRTEAAARVIAARLASARSKPLPALKELADYSLLQRAGKDSVQIHRLVQEVTRARLPEPAERHAWLSDCIHLVDAYATGDPHDPQTWVVWDPLRPHVLSAVSWAEKANLFEPAGRLLSQLGVLLLRKAVHVESADCMRRALRLRARHFGPRSAEVAGIEGNLGTVSERLDQLAEAELHYQRALAIFEERQLGESADAANVLNNLAALYVSMNRFDEAAAISDRAVTLDRKLLPPGSPKLAPGLSNRGSLLWRLGRFVEAEAAYREALAITEQQHGSAYPEASTIRSNLGLLLQDLGRFQEAEESFRESLEADTAIFGAGHPAVGRDCNNLALLLRLRGKLSEAENLLRETLEKDQRTFGDKHSEVADGYSNLGLVLTDMGRDEEAEQCFRRALAIDEEVHGASHLRVAIVCLNLSFVLRNRGDLAGAMTLGQRALDIQTSKLGEDHPEVASTWNNLGRLAQLDGRLPLARAALRHAMSIDRKAFGRRHSRLGTRLNNLAHIYWQEGRLDRAERLYRAALIADRATHGPAHPEIAVDLYNYAELLRARGRVDEARARHAEAVEIARLFLTGDAERTDLRLRGIVDKWETSTTP